MRKKLGEIFIKKKGKDYKSIKIWGSCWKSDMDDGDFMGGVAINIGLDDIHDLTEMVLDVMNKCPAYRLQYKESEYGDKYSLNIYSKLSGRTLEWAVNRLKNIKGKDTDKDIEWEFKVDKNFKYVVDSNILKNI